MPSYNKLMANTKTKTSKKSNPLTVLGLAPVVLTFITVILVLITGTEIMACTQFAAEAGKPQTVDCIDTESGETAECGSSIEIGYIIEQAQMQTYHSVIITLICATLLSAGIDVAYLSLARK